MFEYDCSEKMKYYKKIQTEDKQYKNIDIFEYDSSDNNEK